MAASKQSNPKKFVIEYFDKGKLSSRWTYDRDVFANGPILVEDFDDLPPEKKKKKKKVVK